MVNEFTLQVNGREHVVRATKETPLLYVLRNQLQLTGPRLGCGLGQCGACAVLADGRAIRSCTTPVAAAAGKRIHTVEGLPLMWSASRKPGTAAPATLHPIQQAWLAVQVPQCGYCQSGMMIAAADLLARVPSPTVAQIKDAFTNTPPSPHLCRCGAYTAIIEAVQRAAAAMKV